MTRSQRRKIGIIVLLLILLALTALWYLNYRSTRSLELDITPVENGVVEPPQYLYSFNGGEAARMQRPVGVFVDTADVFVVDSKLHKIGVYSIDGDLKRSFGASETVTPLYIAKNPKDGNLYVTDRRTRSIHIFTTAGKYVRDFDPKLPESELPDFETGGVQWAPVAIAFAPDGAMYVTEILNGHRLLIFDSAGQFKKSVGTVGMVVDAEKAPGVFQFPNGIAVFKNLVYVTDSNNRRVQVFDLNGTSKDIIVTQGLPRGISFLAPFRSDTKETPDRFVVVDTLAHDGTLWSTKGDKIVNFGQQGVLEGEFSYPNGISVGARNKIFVSDTANGRVQVWGWPDQVSPVPVPRVPQNWWWCLTPLLLLPILFLLRKKRFVATRDFVETMLAAGEADLMPARRRRWIVTEADYEVFRDVEQGDIKLGELLHSSEYSESDVNALMEKLEIDKETAIVLSLGKRAHVFCTEGVEMRRLAKLSEIEVVNRVEFIERFTEKGASADSSGPGETP